MYLAIFARCLLIVLVQDVCVGGSVHRLITGDTQGQGHRIQGEGQWVETRYTESEQGIMSVMSSRDIRHMPENESKSRARLRRATNNSTDKIWPYGPYDIPVVISSEFKGNTDRLWRVMRLISDRLCVKFHNVTTTFDRKNPQWFTSNGFKSNSYVLINQKSGCSANIGAGTAPGPRNVSPCNSFTMNLHEMFHVVGVIHEQKATGRDSYISVQFDNVLPSYEQTYVERTDSDLLVHNFDPKTVIIYYDSSFGSNGLETFTFVRDDSVWYDIPMSHENNLFTELNSIYKCNELYCNNNKTDCGPGYFALVYGKCRCVCPDDLDPATNCQEQINQPTKTVSWPQTPTTVLGANGCPSGFNETAGLLPVTGFSKPTQGLVPIPISTKTNTMELPICTKTEPKDPAGIDWLSWPPGGNYCIFKPRGVTCGGAFKEGSLQLTTAGGEGPTGDVGDTVVDGNVTVIKFCCQKDDTADMPLDLPNADPFRLIAYYNSCPIVRGMTVTKGSVKMYTKKTTASGVLPPKYSATASSITLYQCLYTPPVYGCNRVVTLDATNSSVRITTPGFDTKREPNRRCFYGFKTPKNSQLRLTFNSYDVHVNDKFLVKRYHAWQDAQRVKNDHYPQQIVSVHDYLSLEYWSSWETTSKKGLDFTVDLLLEQDFCYNLTKKGEDYKGDKSVSETYEDCIPWEKATSCRDFPFDDLSLLASANKCRNPNGKLDQPWCYTYMSETECYKRYCDVCNIKSPVDNLGNCSSLIQADPSYCTGAVGRFGCFKTCGMSLQTYVLSSGDGGNLSATVPSEFDDDSCNDDDTTLCEAVLAVYPTFCTDQRFAVSQSRCNRSCGRCAENTQCVESLEKPYHRISADWAVDAGHVMNLSCNDGLYHVGGDLQRACSSSGVLLGNEPVCADHQQPLDLKLETLRQRKYTITAKKAYLVDHDGYRIPFDGKATKWYYYSLKSATLVLFVYRPRGNVYDYVGSNNITTVPNWKMSYNVPEAEQISVKKGDVFGVYTLTSGTISINSCEKFSVKIMSLPTMTSSTFAAISKSNQTFPAQSCTIPSLGLRLEP